MLGYTRLCVVVFAMITMAAMAKPPQTAPAPAPSNNATITAMQDDARKMHAILDQMKENIGFVGGTTTPVNHLLQLEIDMWQLQLDQMDRQIAEMKEKK